MSQKVWVIPDPDWEKPPAKSLAMDNQGRNGSSVQNRIGNRSLPGKAQKSPALSFSLSMIVWGGGHMYLREYRPGWMFLVSMLFFYSAALSAVLFRDFFTPLIAKFDMPASVLVVGCMVLFLLGLSCWLFNAVDSYFRTARLRSEPFQGVDNEFWPLLCSVLFPGWGQFVNGQPKKGLFFLLFGIMGIFSVFILFVGRNIWPVLETSHDRLIFESYLAAALFVIPISFLMWIVSAYDSFRSCRASLISKLRLHYAGKRERKQGLEPGYFPRLTAILGLLLAISVGIQLFPKGYYLGCLEKIRMEMLNRNMEIIPELVRKTIDLIGHH